jgi:hypothetical protein
MRASISLLAALSIGTGASLDETLAASARPPGAVLDLPDALPFIILESVLERLLPAGEFPNGSFRGRGEACELVGVCRASGDVRGFGAGPRLELRGSTRPGVLLLVAVVATLPDGDG